MRNPDYTKHPAYSPYYNFGTKESIFRNPTKNLAETMDAISNCQTDEAVERHFTSEVTPALRTVKNLLKNEIPQSVATVAVENALDKAALDVLNRARFQIGRKLKFESRESTVRRRLDDLKSDRISVARLPSSTIQSIREDLSPYIAEIKSRADKLQFNYRDVLLPFRGSYWNTLKQSLNKEHLLETSSHYLGYELEPWYCALVYSRQNDTWWQTPYSDANVPQSDLAYLHVDQGHEIIKCLVYLDEVSPEQGPYSYFTETDRNHFAFQDQLFCQLDHQWPQFYKNEVSNPKGFYRPHCLSTDFRKLFVNLPEFFRGSSHFGDDVLNDTPMSRDLLSREVAVTSDRGNSFIFFGGDLLHRGGIVRKGERLALQMGFLMKRPFYKDLKKKTINTAYNILGKDSFEKLKSMLK
jgi:hypothetical protein